MSTATIDVTRAQIDRATPETAAPDIRIAARRTECSSLMPFGGDVRVEQRRAVLESLRLKHLLGKLSVAGPYGYETDIAYTAVQDISTHALDKVASADVVIAFLQRWNLSVMYESRSVTCSAMR
jgi:hypothetical protein